MDHHSARELIGRAVRFLGDVPDYVWDGESIPVPVEEIADSHLGLRVRDVEEMDAAPGLPADSRRAELSGLLLPAEREIWVNAREARAVPRRRRYTIAHEIGHWVLHRDAADTVRCRAEQVRPEEPFEHWLGEVEEELEFEANVFGGALLIPPALLRRHWDGDRAKLPAVADAFEISESALEGRHHSRVYQHYGWYEA